MPQVFHLAAFFFVIHQRTVKVAVQQQVAQVVLAHQLRIFLPPKGLDLPSRRPVISLHRRHSLQRKRLPHQVRPLVLLPHRRGKPSAAFKLGRHAEGLDGLHLLHPAPGFNVLGNQFVRGLRVAKRTAAADSDQHNHGMTHRADSCS